MRLCIALLQLLYFCVVLCAVNAPRQSDRVTGSIDRCLFVCVRNFSLLAFPKAPSTHVPHGFCLDRLGQRIAKSSNSDGVEPVPVHPADLWSIVQKNLNDQRKRQIGQAIAHASTRMARPSATAKRQRPSSALPRSSRAKVGGQRIERPSTATGSRVRNKKRPVSAKFKKKGRYKVTVRPISATPATGIKFSTSRKANPLFVFDRSFQ